MVKGIVYALALALGLLLAMQVLGLVLYLMEELF